MTYTPEKLFENKIADLGVYELREVARNVGVKSPTTKKREELIDFINRALKGELNDKQSKKGRPAKGLKINSSFLSDLMPDINNSLTEESNYDPINMARELVFNSNSYSELEALTEETMFVEGIVRKTDNDIFFFKNISNLEKSQVVVFSKELATKREYCIGDYITGYAKKTDKNNFMILRNIHTLNKLDSEIIEKRVEEKELILPNKQIDKLNFCMNFGERTIINTKNDKESFATVITNIDNIISSNLEIVCLSLQSTIENKIMLNNRKKITNITTFFEDDLADSHDLVIDTIALCKNYYCHGKNVVLIINDITNTFNLLNTYFIARGKSLIQGSTLEASKLIKSLFGLAKCNANGASISVIATNVKDSGNDAMNEVYKMATNLIEK